MRIALLTSQWPGARLGGIGVYTISCALGLAREGHEVHLFTPILPVGTKQDWHPGIHVHELDIVPIDTAGQASIALGGATLYRMASALAFRDGVMSVHRETPLDVIEAPEYEAPAGQLLAGEIPVIAHVHSGSAIANALDAARSDSPEQLIRESLELEVLLGSDGVCAPSAAVMQDTRDAYQLDIRPDAQTLPLPFDAPEAPFVMPDKDATVLFVGRLERLKGADLLATAADGFLRRYPTAQLRIIGPDTMTAPRGEAHIAPHAGRSMADWMGQQLGADVADRAVFVGEQGRATIAAEMQRCAFVVIPSLRESYSYVCCEAMAAGRPVIVSATIGAAEVAGDAGLRFERGNASDLQRAMCLMWENADLRARLSKIAYERARTTLSGAAVIGQRVAFYESVIGRRRMHGLDDIRQRLAALPSPHGARIKITHAIANGTDLDRIPQWLRQAGLRKGDATPGQRVVAALDGIPNAFLFYLYGAGRHTAALLLERAIWEAKGYRLAGLIDDHPRFQAEPRFLGFPVMSIRAATEKLNAGDIVVLSTDAFEDQFWRQSEELREKGVHVRRLYG